MMRSNRIRRWEQSDDLLQQTLLRLNRSLQRTEASTVKAFLELAALEMRHALVDLARRYFGPEGLGTHHDSHLDGTHDKVASVFVSAATGWLARQDSWRRLYEAVEALPDEEREVVDLIWIHELTHAEVAALLNVATKTIARRWARARLKLHEALGDEMIGI